MRLTAIPRSDQQNTASYDDDGMLRGRPRLPCYGDRQFSHGTRPKNLFWAQAGASLSRQFQHAIFYSGLERFATKLVIGFGLNFDMFSAGVDGTRLGQNQSGIHCAGSDFDAFFPLVFFLRA